MTTIIANILLYMYLLNALVPLLTVLSQLLVNFSLRTDYDWSDKITKYQDYKYHKMGRVTEPADVLISCIMMDCIVGGVVFILSLAILQYVPWIFVVIAIPFVLRFITGLMK